MQQRTLDLRVLRILCAGPCHDYNVQAAAEQILVEAVALPDQSRDAVPDNTVPYFFAD